MDFIAEKRSDTRTPIDENVDIYIITQPMDDESQSNSQTYSASVVDISATGMGITCNAPLKKGDLIGFREGQLNWELPAQGVVVWSYSHSSGQRAGIEFII